MPRNGSGVFTLPAGSVVSNGDVSDASDINSPLADLEADMNTPRPVVAGGTGASTAADARTNLGAQVEPASNGLVVRTSAGAAAARTITAGAGISVADGDGVSGNPTISASGITTTQIAAATLVTASETIASNNNDTTLPTSAAVKGYADGIAIGVGQVWANQSRALSTNYTNTTGRPIQVSIRMTLAATSGTGSATLTIAGVDVGIVTLGESNGTGWNATANTLTAIVPPGAVYAVTGTNASILSWSELR